MLCVSPLVIPHSPSPLYSNLLCSCPLAVASSAPFSPSGVHLYRFPIMIICLLMLGGVGEARCLTFPHSFGERSSFTLRSVRLPTVRGTWVIGLCDFCAELLVR